MTAEQKAQWVAVLRSGEWVQGKRRLHSTMGGGQTVHCCLGVADELFTLESKSVSHLSSEETIAASETIFLPMRDQSRLINANDSGKTFAEIADIIESEIHPTE